MSVTDTPTAVTIPVAIGEWITPEVVTPRVLNSKTDSPQAGARFESVAELRAAHSQLLRRYHQGGISPEFREAAQAFIRAGRATGALIDDEDDRLDSQRMLDHWATILYRAKCEPPDATLEEFDPDQLPTLPDELRPYIGLSPFQESYYDLFFGRQRLVEKLVQELKEHRLLAVTGPSGSGKSSLVSGGLLPLLKLGKAETLPSSDSWRYYPAMVPGSDPIENLARLLHAGSTPDQIASAAEALRQNPRHLAQLMDGAAPAVLVVDQFEEVFTLCEDTATRQAFIDNLLSVVEVPEVQHRVILTMRSDYEPSVVKLPTLYKLFERSNVRVTPLNEDELREAIERPAEKIGLKFQPGVVDALLQDILGEPAALPLLQFTLLKLWENRDHNRVTLDSYRRLGGARLALANSADEFYEQELSPEQQITARRILLRMVRLGEGLEVTSNRIRRETLYQTGEDPSRINLVLDKLIDARLIRLTQRETPEDDQVEVAHEALVRNWPRLVKWLEDERVALTMRRRLDDKVAEWVRLGSGSAGLLDAIQLKEAEEWLRSSEALALGYDQNLPALVKASRAAIEAAEREKQAAEQEKQVVTELALQVEKQRLAEAKTASLRFRWLAAALAMATLLAMVQWQIADDNRREAEKQQTIAVAKAREAEEAKIAAEKERDATKSLVQTIERTVSPQLAEKILQQQPEHTVKRHYWRWLAACRRKDIETYMTFYSPTVQVQSLTESYQGAAERRRKTIARWNTSAFIEIEGKPPFVWRNGDQIYLKAHLSVRQSDGYSIEGTKTPVTGIKTLVWSRVNGSWVIVKETFVKDE